MQQNILLHCAPILANKSDFTLIFSWLKMKFIKSFEVFVQTIFKELQIPDFIFRPQKILLDNQNC